MIQLKPSLTIKDENRLSLSDRYDSIQIEATKIRIERVFLNNTENNNNSLLTTNNVKIINSFSELQKLAEKFNVPISDVIYIDFNLTGVCLPNKEVRVGFRSRFIANLNSSNKRSTYFALPVRAENDSYYIIKDNKLQFQENIIANIEDLQLDTCDVSYSRGPNLEEIKCIH